MTSTPRSGTCRISSHDGHKVKVTLQFRGREMAHPELGSKILDAVIEQSDRAAKVETQARLEGRNMTMVLAPDKKAQEAIKKAAEEAAAEQAAAEAAARDTPAVDVTAGTASNPRQRSSQKQSKQHRRNSNSRWQQMPQQTSKRKRRRGANLELAPAEPNQSTEASRDGNGRRDRERRRRWIRRTTCPR